MTFSRFFAAAAVAAVFSAGSASLAAADVIINVNKSTQRMSVVVDGFERWQWPVSSGMHGRDTPSGSFKAFRMEKDHFSKEWDDAPMPNSIFFTMKGHAIHGSYDLKHLGQPVSHGCVRLAPQNAALLFDLVKKEGMSHTQVILTGEGGDPSSYGPNGREPNFFEALFGPHPQPAAPPVERKSRRRADRDRT
jgi:lipoprotein-anchoring transpeptidase ErfK/SrfK